MVHPIQEGGTPPGERPSGPPRAPGRSRYPGPVPGGKPAAARPPARERPAGGSPRAGARGQGSAPAGQREIRLTGRGAIVGMFVLFLLGLLVSGLLNWLWLAGLVFVAGSAAAARYTNRRDLLAVAVSPPLVFLAALVPARVLTSGGHLLVAAEGILLALASAAPWLFAGVAVNLIIGMSRGLANSVRELRSDLRDARRGLPERARPAAHPTRPTPQ